MMDSHFPEFYRYCRSKGSAFGHSVRTKDPVLAWEKAIKFLREFTDFGIGLPIEVTQNAQDGNYDRKKYEGIVALFGSPTSHNDHWIKWSLDRQLDSDIETFIKSNFSYSPGYEYEIRIHMYFVFTWKRKFLPEMVEYEDAINHFFKDGNHGIFSISVENRVFIQPEFLVPINNWEKLHATVGKLKEALPFKLHEKSLIAFRRTYLKSGKLKFKSLGYYNE